ncbi:MAG: NADH-quinone oxidoreductase subunit C [Euryarchaeota archaeon]|nr:NADH-quinone oxidoreductase subunit C [Euryarchaeota archaeon]
MASKASDKFEEATNVQADAYIAERPLLDIPSEQLPQVAGELLSKGARLVYETGIDMGVDGFDLFYFFSSDGERTSPQTLLRVRVPREDPVIASLASITPQASWAEREVMEMLGVRFTGHPDPRHLWLPYEWPRPAEADYQRNEAIMRPKGAAANLLPIGPYHPATLDSNLFRMTVEGETILDIDIKIGYNHRGIIKLFEGRDYHKGMFLAERVCGICNCAHTTTYCTAVEQMAAVEVPARAKYIRMLMVELERIQNHFLWLGLFVNVMGFTTGFMLSWRAREVVQDTMELVSGQRISHGMNTIGGVRKDIPSAVSSQVAQLLEDIRGKVAHLERIILENPVISDRARSIGTLSPKTASEYGALGPVMRGSGNRVDVRLNKPYLAYNDVDWHIVTDRGCDAYARMLVRIGEMHVSLDICKQALDNLKAMPTELAVKGFTIEKPYGLAQVEAPRGEVVYLIAASEYMPNMPLAVRIRTPTYNNLPLLKTLLVGCDVGDVPVILSSIDPCFACTDRLTEVSKTHNRVEFAWTWNG